MTGYTYTKADFDRMHFEIDKARDDDVLNAFLWGRTPQGCNFWFSHEGSLGASQRAALADMIAQYEAIHASADEVSQ